MGVAFFGKRERSGLRGGGTGSGSPGGNEGDSEKSSGEGLQKILAVLHRGGDVGADLGEPTGTRKSAKAAGDLLLDLEHAKVAFLEGLRLATGPGYLTVDSKIPAKSAIRLVEKIAGGCVSRSRAAKRQPDFGRTSAAGSYSHVDLDSTEVFGGPGGRIYEGQECDPYRSGLSGTEKEL